MKGLLFTYALTYGGAVVSLFNPYIGLLIYIAFSILKPEALWHWSVPAGNYSRTIALALLAGWAINGFGDWSLGRARWMVAMLLGFLLWSMFSAGQTEHQDIAWLFVENMAKVVLPFLVGITTIKIVSQVKQLAWVIVSCCGYLAFEANLSYLQDRINTVQEFGLPGIPDNNAAAIAMVTCLGLTFFLALNNPIKWQKVLLVAMSCLMGHTILLSFSRGGMISLIVTGAVCFALIPRQPKHYALLLVAALGALYLTGPELRARFETSFAEAENRDASAAGRLDMWAACLDLMQKYPLTGTGPDTFGLYTPNYGYEKGKEAHSTWLQTGAELGLPGLAFLALFYLSCINRLWAVRKGAQGADPWLSDAARMVIASLAGFMFSAQFVTLEGLETPYYVALLGAGVLKLQTAAVTQMLPVPAHFPLAPYGRGLG